jgi:two-component system, NarL family, response regulator DegU
MIRQSVLTYREREVLDLVAEGKSNREVAQVLELTEYTINKHLNHIFKKLHVHKRMEAVQKIREEENEYITR